MKLNIAVLTCVKYIGISGTINELSVPTASDCVLHPTQKRYIPLTTNHQQPTTLWENQLPARVYQKRSTRFTTNYQRPFGRTSTRRETRPQYALHHQPLTIDYSQP
ncbi:MAG: hypothetical protein ACHBN1_02125 [Heteroscytonema crispum UTEX LB 1556]